MERPRSPAQGAPDLERRLATLRERMLGLSRRRVAEEDVEDVVQTAMKIVIEKGVLADDRPTEGLPPVAWCLQVLRNVIGNHYRRRRTRQAHVDRWDEATVTPGVDVELATALDRVQALEDALDEFAASDESCGRILRRLADGHRARDIAEEVGQPTSSLYQRIYRCREKFRSMLRERGVLE